MGKSTLARLFVEMQHGPVAFFDLEDDEDLARPSDTMLALMGLRGLVVLDEIQQRPDLFRVLRVLADRPRPSCRFLVLGSASPEMLRQSSETLAGRIVYHRLGGFALDEVNANEWNRLWCRGGFPRSFLARSDADSMEWRRGFIPIFVERDLPQWGIRIALCTVRRFWTMLGQVFQGIHRRQRPPAWTAQSSATADVDGYPK